MCDFDPIEDQWEEYEYGIINNHEVVNGEIWVQVNWKIGTKKFGQIIPLNLIRKNRTIKIQNYLKKLKTRNNIQEMEEINEFINQLNL